MSKSAAAVVTETKLNNDAVTDATVTTSKTVTYEFETTTSRKLTIPYAVVVGGMIRSEFRNTTKRVRGNFGHITVLNVEPGCEVSLFLNSDAHPDYRKNPVYSVRVKDNDVIVKITEKMGKHPDTDAVVPCKDTSPVVNASKKYDSYTAVLTGDIWMKISHRYSPAELIALLPPDTLPTVATAIQEIYAGLQQPSVKIASKANSVGNDELTTTITFQDGDNARKNISAGYDFLREGLTRVHPTGYEAIFRAALEAGVDHVRISSVWRPLLGSIAHRAGLGIDIAYLGRTQMNRQELRSGKVSDTPNVSEDEKKLIVELDKAKAEEAEVKKKIAIAQYDIRSSAGTTANLIAAKARLAQAITAGSIAQERRKKAEIEWIAERDKNEPQHVRHFRQALTRSASILQVFDPWTMDANTKDNAPAVPNFQLTANEELHAHHLHLTVNEPKLL